MLKVGDQFPDVTMKAVVSTNLSDAFIEVNQATYQGKWRVVFFWPKDFTFVCPTEIAEFDKLYTAFAERDAQLLGVSTDSEFVHLAWREQNELLRELQMPMLSDIKRELSQALGILDSVEGVAQRATYIVDPDNRIRFVMVTDLNV